MTGPRSWTPLLAPYRRVKRLSRRWRDFARTAARFKPYLVKRRSALLMALALSLTFTAMRLLEPWPLKLLIDGVLLGQPLSWPFADLPLIGDDGGSRLLYAAVGLLVLNAFLRGYAYYHSRRLVARLGVETTAELRLNLYSHVQYLPLSFHDRRRTGDLIVRLTSDVRMLRQAFVTLPIELAEAVLLMGGMAVVMALMDWQLTLVALILLPALAFLVRRYQRPLKQAVRKQREREGHLASIAAEALSAIRVVQGFHRERDEIKRFGGENARDRRAGVRAATYEAKLRWSTELAVAVVTSAIILFASHRILAGSLSVGDLIVFLTYLRVYARPMQRTSRTAQRITRATAAGERILQILDLQPAVRDLPGAVVARRLRGEITFEGVDFAYRSGRPSLEGIDLRIAPGERVALVGPTGAGKSTLVSLIPRFYEPTSGRVLVDGRDVRDYTLASLRKHISLVFQEPVLFSTTIAENIAYGRSGATMEDVVEAARRVRVHRVIERLRDGYETVVGERGANLSGGQRQCIAIARAMIRNAPIVILDEPTVGLDVESAELVTAALDRLIEGKTTIVISHNFDHLRSVDRVVVLDRGRIVGEYGYAEFRAAARDGSPWSWQRSSSPA